MSSEKKGVMKALSTLLEYFSKDESVQEVVKQTNPEQAPEQVTKSVDVEKTIKKSLDEEQRKATFVVLAPDEVDLHGDIYTAEEIEKASDSFREHCQKANLAHMLMVDEQSVVITESYIAPVDMTIGEVNVTKGTWLQTWKFNDDSLWQGVKGGHWDGLSIQCKALTEEL